MFTNSITKIEYIETIKKIYKVILLIFGAKLKEKNIIEICSTKTICRITYFTFAKEHNAVMHILRKNKLSPNNIKIFGDYAWNGTFILCLFNWIS